MNIGCIIQARLGSTRLAGKVLRLLDNQNTVLDYTINQTRESKLIDKIIIATTTLSEDDKIVNQMSEKKVDCFRGDPSDVLDRYYQCAKKFSIPTIVRITSDCPLMDPNVIDDVITKFQNDSYDYVSNVHPITYPIGIAVEVFSFRALEDAWKNAKLPSEREHVTPYMYNHEEKFKVFNVEYSGNLSNIRLTVDRINDLELVKMVVSKIKNRPILLSDILDLYRNEPRMFEINQNYDVYEGYNKSLNEDKEFLKFQDK